MCGGAALGAAMCFGATTEDGVTKERRGALGPNDTVVTDVDTTGIVAARTYTKDEIDRRIATNAPVRSVNGKTGRVVLGANDVGALPNNRDGLKANANFRNAVWDVQIKSSGGVNTNAVLDIVRDEIIPATNRLNQTLSDAIDAHVADTNNPHAVTSAQVGALPLVEDSEGAKTSVTIGSRNSDGTVGKFSLANGTSVTASGYGSHAEGYGTTASGVYSHAEGYGTTASGVYSHAEGDSTTASGTVSHAGGFYAQTRSSDSCSFAWNGDETRTDPYESHGPGTFNVNPYGGLAGFYIGEKTLYSILTNKADKADISAENQTFSNAVLAVGLNIDTNAVAVLNDIAETFGGFPIEGAATTVGGLLAALAAAAAWLKRNKADKATTLAGYGITDAATKAALDAKADKANTIPKYEFVTAAIADGVLTVAPYTNAHITSDGTAFSISVGADVGHVRDCILVVECGDTAPTMTWGQNFHPRTDAETDFACVAGVRNVYWITEYAPDEFVVAGWHETAGGNAS